MGELRAAGTLTQRPNTGRARLQPIANLDVASCVERDVCDLEADACGIGLTTCGDQNVACSDVTRTGSRAEVQTDFLPGPTVNAQGLGGGHDIDALLCQETKDLGANIEVFATSVLAEK
jgi:hypothetical protein